MMALVPDDEDDEEDHGVDEEEEELLHDLTGDAAEMQRLNREILRWNLLIIRLILHLFSSFKLTSTCYEYF